MVEVIVVMLEKNDIEVLKRALERERVARKEAERLLEEKSVELYEVNQELKALNNSLEQQILTRTEELDRSRNEQRSTALKLGALIQNLQAGVLVEDETRHIVLVNQHFLTLFGIPAAPEHLIGVDCSQSAEQSKAMFVDPEGFVARIDTILAERKVVIGDEMELVDGRFFERDFIPVISENRYWGHLWHYKDITSRKQSEQQLLLAKQQAEASSKAREVFLANISHEIRTPMNAILGMSDLLLTSHQDPKEHQQLEVIRRSADNLLVLINDLLDLTKIDSGKLRLENIGFHLDEQTRFIIQALDLSASQQNIQLRHVSDPNLPPVVLGDPYRLNQILTNLINNAIKFTEKGSVTLRTSLLAREKDRVKVRFLVQDTGIGIDQAKLQEIFESFRQADETITRRFGGTGLGLTISRKLVQLLGGEIDVESEPGMGTTFRVDLDFEVGSKEDLPRRTPVADSLSRLENSRILVVEDHAYNQMLTVSILEEWGVEVRVASNGKAALEELRAGDFDLVLMDVQMPIMDGLQATLAIRNELRKDVPIIGLSANAYDSEAQRCLSAGMNDFMTKPFSPEQLRRTISAFLGGGAVPPIPTQSRVNFSRLLSHVNQNEDLALKLINVFQETLPQELDRLKAAAENNDPAGFCFILHQFRPSLKMLATSQFQQSIEDMGHTVESSPELLIGTSERIVSELNALSEEIRAQKV